MWPAECCSMLGRARGAGTRQAAVPVATVSMLAVKRLVATVIGGTILVIGLALLVLPGPAFIVIPIGLAVLGTEYVWARRWLKRARNMVNPRNAKRTTRVLRQALEQRWERWRAALAGWASRWVPGRRKPETPADGTRPADPPTPTVSQDAVPPHRTTLVASETTPSPGDRGQP